MKKSNIRALSLVSIASLMLAGCASGPTISETPNIQTPPVAGMSRIVVYRTGILGAAIQPIVSVDGKETGRCTANGVFFIDVPKGQHQVSATTEITRQTIVDTSNVDTAYVRCSIGFGFIVGQPRLEVVFGNQGASETAGLAYTGSY